jgi:type I restriction enzyme R subunit
MRDVKSKNYYEQMKGRGTRIFDADSLRKVTPSAATNKTHFVIVDAVGVSKSLKTSTQPLERKKGVPLKDLMMAVHMGLRDDDTLTSLGNRLTRMEKQISPKEKEEFKQRTGGRSIQQVVGGLLEAHDPDGRQETGKTHGASSWRRRPPWSSTMPPSANTWTPCAGSTSRSSTR